MKMDLALYRALGALPRLATMKLDGERPGDTYTLLIEPDPWSVALNRDDALALAGVLHRGDGSWAGDDVGSTRRLTVSAERHEDGVHAVFRLLLPDGSGYSGAIDAAGAVLMAGDLRFRATNY